MQSYDDNVEYKIRGRTKLRKRETGRITPQSAAGRLLAEVWQRLDAGETAEAVAADLGVPADMVREVLRGQ